MYIIGMYLKDRKSTRLNSSHVKISYAVFCLKDAATTTFYTLSLHDALPISTRSRKLSMKVFRSAKRKSRFSKARIKYSKPLLSARGMSQGLIIMLYFLKAI